MVRRQRGAGPLLGALAMVTTGVRSLPGVGCQNDTNCYQLEAWQCTEVSSGGSPCRINGQQPPQPPYTPWPVRTCECTATRCGPSPSPPSSASYGCRSGRCFQVLANGTQNTSQTCEWATGCVPLEPQEWLAATFEFEIKSTTATCVHDHAFLKKSEVSSGSLPSDMKLAVPQGAVITLTTVPPPSQDGYFVISCANGSVCAAKHAQNPVVEASLSSYLMIGDSISLGYEQGVVNALAGKFAVTHSAGNAGNANNIAHRLDCYLDQVGNSPDVVTFNAGIHDLARGQEWLSLVAYKALIANVTTRLVATKARVIFATTTPVPTNGTNPLSPACPEGIVDADVRAYNAAAAAIVSSAGGEVLDLHGVITAACGGVGYTTCPVQEANNPHFVEQGWALLAQAVAARVARE